MLWLNSFVMLVTDKVCRERNREHAKRSRSKKKDLTKQLEESLVILKEENDKLRRFVHQRMQSLNPQSVQDMVQERIVTPIDRFTGALKKPSNRVLSNSAISYLKSMSAEISKTKTEH